MLNRKNNIINGCKFISPKMYWYLLAMATVVVMHGLMAAGASAQASNVYITPDGGGTGVCTSNVHSLSWFNSSANWGTGSAQIGPGTIVHLCGTFTAAAGADSFVQFQGSGSSGHPITLRWESGAIVQAPYFSNVHGGIDVNGKSYITIDGGSNGIIRNTANGTGMSFHKASVLISGMGSNNTITNLSLLNNYVHTNGDASGEGSHSIHAVGGSNMTIGPNNTFTQADVGVFYAWNGGEQNLAITGNNFSGINQNIEMGPANTGTKIITNVSIDHNTATNWVNWDNPGNNYHHNFFHPFVISSAAMVGNLQIFDNTLSGDMGNHATSMIFLEANNGGSGGTMGSWYIFNNTFDKTNSTAPTSSGIVAVYPSKGYFVNNVIRDAGGSGSNGFPSLHLYGGASGWTVKNNIFQGGAYMVYNESASGSFDRNVYYHPASDTPWIWGSSFKQSMSQWQSACGCDSGSVTTNPMLNADLTVQSGSPAAGLGLNLSSIGLSALNFDKEGVLRPVGSWTSGASEIGSTSTQKPNPPTGLSATVN